jgi:hypothetical protein
LVVNISDIAKIFPFGFQFVKSGKLPEMKSAQKSNSYQNDGARRFANLIHGYLLVICVNKIEKAHFN